ncbi:MAG: hypothetical protein BZ151_05300 [Desulfobacca sp. 4484_104]|nr:MAG: hypothetical protein BZ151_05300 [Desulfobacca sp. 4484_104]
MRLFLFADNQITSCRSIRESARTWGLVWGLTILWLFYLEIGQMTMQEGIDRLGVLTEQISALCNAMMSCLPDAGLQLCVLANLLNEKCGEIEQIVNGLDLAAE